VTKIDSKVNFKTRGQQKYIHCTTTATNIWHDLQITKIYPQYL